MCIWCALCEKKAVCVCLGMRLSIYICVYSEIFYALYDKRLCVCVFVCVCVWVCAYALIYVYIV